MLQLPQSEPNRKARRVPKTQRFPSKSKVHNMQLQQVLLLLASCLGLSHGLALYTSYPSLYTAQGSAVITPTQQQYLTQDVLGQYAYGYAEPLSRKQEIRGLDGKIRGTYSFVDATGKLQTVEYTADADGFHVAATNLPVAASSNGEPRLIKQQPVDSVEVAAARKSHFAAHEDARLQLAQVQSQSAQSQSQQAEQVHPVADTAEVAAAKSNHLQRVASEKLRNEIISASRSSSSSTSHVLVPLPSVYSSVYSVPHYYSSGFYY